MGVTRREWTAFFLTITALAIVFELIASFDGNPSTVPWTWLIVDNVSVEVFVPIFCALVGWLVIHFYLRYTGKVKPPK